MQCLEQGIDRASTGLGGLVEAQHEEVPGARGTTSTSTSTDRSEQTPLAAALNHAPQLRPASGSPQRVPFPESSTAALRESGSRLTGDDVRSGLGRDYGTSSGT